MDPKKVGATTSDKSDGKWSLKRSANNSEEELSEASSSNSEPNQQPLGKMASSNAKTSPKSRRPLRANAGKRKWFDSDRDWNADEARINAASSDSDPAWSPCDQTSKQNGKNDSKERQTPRKRQCPNRNSKSVSPSETQARSTINSMSNEVEAKKECNLSANELSVQLRFAGYTHNTNELTYESGKFIMLKSDFKRQKNPCLWRIDGKNLLQKYEPITYKGGTGYRNISTYSSWITSNHGLYIPIETEFAFQSKAETVVKFNSNSVMLPVRKEVADKIREESNSLEDSFQIYLQTLISQALDANFLIEIEKENDDYFLTSIGTVEQQWVLPRITALKEKRNWPKHFYEALECYPDFDLSSVTSGEKCCTSCHGRNPTRKFTFQSLMYEYETLKTTETGSSQILLLCLACTDGALLYHQLYHFRYNMFAKCSLKINEATALDPDVDGPTVLKACLADQQWTSDMLQQTGLILAEADHYT